MLRVITLNLNGIRSAAKKGFFKWLRTQNADIVCVQEVKAHVAKLKSRVFKPKGYFSYFADAKKIGYSGVGIYCRKEPDRVIQSFGWGIADKEGRYLQVDFGNLSIISLYMPSGTMGPHRQAVKYRFMKHFYKHLQKMLREKRDFIICGDWNIVHQRIDIKNWTANQKHTGCLPEERAWLSTVFDKLGWVDAFRVINQKPDQYTWWSRRGRAREKNVGWRIDYQIVSPSLKDKIKSEKIYLKKIFSDHAPLRMDYDYQLD